jgi:hypothetical protein
MHYTCLSMLFKYLYLGVLHKELASHKLSVAPTKQVRPYFGRTCFVGATESFRTNRLSYSLIGIFHLNVRAYLFRQVCFA